VGGFKRSLSCQTKTMFVFFSLLLLHSESEGATILHLLVNMYVNFKSLILSVLIIVVLRQAGYRDGRIF